MIPVPLFRQTKFKSSRRDNFRKCICSFLPGAPFSGLFHEAFCIRRTLLIFQEGVFFLSNRSQFSRKLYLFAEQIPIFQEQYFLATEQIPIFQEQFFWPPNRYRFSRSTVLATEQIPTFQETYFKYHRIDRKFQGRKTDISTIGLGDCFRKFVVFSADNKEKDGHNIYQLFKR